ncbi:MAG: hypothetical protein JNL66_11420 [Alphaproteobacteria bacterium]|nr:hypothetical protein [Alphaproteobacteria bacterium]
MTGGVAAGSGAFDALADFARQQSELAWFAAVGEALTDGERAEGLDYAKALGFTDAAIGMVADWPAAERATRGAGYEAWWSAENAERTALLETATRMFGRHPVMTALTHVTEAVSTVVLGAASVAAARSGVADVALARVAAGAATEAAYHAGLARIAGAGAHHPFAVKFRLFAGGRWPLGITGGILHLF